MFVVKSISSRNVGIAHQAPEQNVLMVKDSSRSIRWLLARFIIGPLFVLNLANICLQ